MSNYQTLKNSLKKLESQQHDTDNRQFCGVITKEDLERLRPLAPSKGGNNRHVGYLVVPRKLTEAEWIEKHGP